ncbi:hypothetical protein RS130_07680 [Paraglaciecola aquimarina]|uniref:Uncharacterized protein n=1 Tax=Paraglaciecola aquimarina TaxID=1235557 RepID=A0ABU3SV02_9ALTE|nr:hypothetical protein [Paraglaciecola aquimarina]MDU0353822.1 hypothetical protein [Paraglaciecola aquimarina]
MKNMIVNVLAISVAVGVVGVCQASKLEAAKGILKFSKESLSVAADLKEVFGGDGGDDNSGSGGKKGLTQSYFR